MSWLTGQKDKVVNKVKANYTQTHNHFLQMQTPLTNMERLENWIKLGLWLICSLILFILINIDWFTLAGLYAIVMMMLFWLKGWDPIAHKLAQYWQQQANVDPKLLNVPHFVIAEQRLLNILAISTDWQALSSKDRSLKALRALDAIYRVAVGISSPMDSGRSSTIVTTDTPVSASVDEIIPSTETSTKIQKDDKN
jgi:hypothetical protein